MSAPDDLQRLWQGKNSKPEDPRMWRQLIEAKRRGWYELVRAENQAWYLSALWLAPLVGWAAWKAKYPWVQVGYGLMTATIVLSVIATWIAERWRPQACDRSLREHLEALIESYSARARFLWLWGWWVMAALCAGLVAVILGIPGNVANPRAWVIAVVLATGAGTAQWMSSRMCLVGVSRKREEAARLLQSLLADGQEGR